MRNRAVTIAGVAVVEFALIISVLALLTLAVVDISRAIQAQIILISISREGASLAARSSGLQMQQIMDALGDSATPGASLTRGLLGPFNANGMIYITEVMGYQDTPTSAVRNVVTAKYRWLGGGGYAPSSVVWNCGSWSGGILQRAEFPTDCQRDDRAASRRRVDLRGRGVLPLRHVLCAGDACRSACRRRGWARISGR